MEKDDSLGIALIAPPDERVPPEKYGGTEWVVYALAEGLVERGHDVTLFASGDSKTSAKLIPITERAARTMPEAQVSYSIRRRLCINGFKDAIRYIRDSRDEFDIVHNHAYPERLGSRLKDTAQLDMPFISTFHGILNTPEYVRYQKRHAKDPVVSISYSQRCNLPDVNYIANVYNGVRIPDFTPSVNLTPEDYLIFVGRMSPEKDPITAIKVALKTGRKLVIAAKVDPTDEPWFLDQVLPLIKANEKDIDFRDEVDHPTRDELLYNAYGMINPVNWDEPFGLAPVESEAVGTPVIATLRGSMPEIIVNGITGFLCKNKREMIRAVKNLSEIDRQACQDHARANFSVDKNVAGYLDTYRKAIKLHRGQLTI